MKNIIAGALLLIFTIEYGKAQVGQNEFRFIEVTGSAEINVEPDEIRFHIGIEEYCKEEFEKRKPYKDCITKIPLEEIEKNLMAALTKIGIVKNQIIIKDVGDYWNRSGKKFKKSKTIELVLKDFSLVNEILRKVKVRGVNSMRISDLKNKNISKYREQVKIEAMKAAKRKADYLLSSIGEKLGGVISVVELDGDFLNTWRNQNLLCNSKVNYTLSSNSDNLNKMENIRKIQLRYKIKIRFEIKQDVTSR
tara:strand:- start:19556 stop:20305 length:750 start_codon:yes stop_codon:yes gene_type:complete